MGSKGKPAHDPEKAFAPTEEAIIAYLDGELGPEEAKRVSDHLEACPECRVLAEEHKRVWEALGELPEAGRSEIWPQVASVPKNVRRSSRMARWTAAAAVLAVSLSVASFLHFRRSSPPPEEELLANLSVVEEFVSLKQAGAEEIADKPEIVQAAYELTVEESSTERF